MSSAALPEYLAGVYALWPLGRAARWHFRSWFLSWWFWVVEFIASSVVGLGSPAVLPARWSDDVTAVWQALIFVLTMLAIVGVLAIASLPWALVQQRRAAQAALRDLLEGDIELVRGSVVRNPAWAGGQIQSYGTMGQVVSIDNGWMTLRVVVRNEYLMSLESLGASITFRSLDVPNAAPVVVETARWADQRGRGGIRDETQLGPRRTAILVVAVKELSAASAHAFNNESVATLPAQMNPDWELVPGDYDVEIGFNGEVASPGDGKLHAVGGVRHCRLINPGSDAEIGIQLCASRTSGDQP